MHFQITSKDDFGFLTESSINSTAYASNPSTHRSTARGSSAVTDRLDTIHYLSPASTVAHTEYEGDLDYQQFYVSPLYHDVPYKAGLGSTTTSSSSISCDDSTLQRTVAMIKPEALCYTDVVLRAIGKAGLKIVHQRTVHLTPEQVSEIYEKYYGTPAFPHMVVTVSVSPILVLALQAVNAVEKWKAMVGPMGTLREEWFFPYSVRTRFGLQGDFLNTLHASEGLNDARKESRYLFPRGLTEIVRTKPIDPVISLAEWLLLHNPYQPQMPEMIAMAPT
uniref:Nucleoside diphosphate kinase-like domain-containing protein n=1 Tax=Dendroctonus ponderosae TaxID=77166 RepID=J3JVG9_DENPD|nr:unknown [Dendroctonus ponderosae]